MNDQLMALLVPVLQGLAGQYGMVAGSLMWIATLRLIFKPAMVFLQAFVAITPTSKDNDVLNAVLNSKVYKAIVFLIDLATSIKLPQAAPVVVTPPTTPAA